MSRPNNIATEHLEYLDALRESGETNMWGATPYIEDKFWTDSKHAGEILMYWMKTFGNEDR